MTPTPSSLPIIPILPYLPSHHHLYPSTTRISVSKQMHQACRDIGFFFLDVEGYLTKAEMDEVLDLGREFFGLEEEEKEGIGLEKSDGVRGYQKLHQNVTQGKADHHEGLDIYAPSPYPTTTSAPLTNGPTQLRPLEGPNLWPTRPDNFKPKMEAWIEKMKILGMGVMRCMADGLGMSEAEWEGLRGMIDDSFWVMRAIGYPPLPEEAEGISCGSHKDYGCLTFLHADPIPGSLQVLPPTSQTEEYISITPLPHTLVVNIGSMWELWSGALYTATTHRVIHKSPTYRVSIPFFFEPNFEARVGCLEAAKRVGRVEGRVVKEDEGEVRYGDFLLGKVSGNFKY